MDVSQQAYVADIDELEEGESKVCGPKAANLGRMRKLGIPVPPGFCVTASGYREHLKLNGLDRKLESLVSSMGGVSQEKRSEGLAEFRKAMIDGSMPDEIAKGIGSAYGRLEAASVAVRSSATAEDLPGFSFAGQHDTFLGVHGEDECVLAVKICWASLWSDRAYEYREKNGIDQPNVDMAVLVQEMVQADVAGVIFTVDPVSGKRDRMVIESAKGLGEALVSGKVAPDRMALSRPEMEVIEKQTTEGEGSLDEVIAKRIGEHALRIEEEFGCPQDIEFAVADGNPYILQARPITAIACEPKDAKQVWSNLNTGEVLPDVVSPFTWSLLEPAVHGLLETSFGALGVDISGQPLVTKIAGRAYFNLNTLFAFARSISGLGDKGLTRMLGGSQDAASDIGALKIVDENLPDLGVSRFKMATGSIIMMYKVLTFSPSESERLLAEMKEQVERDIDYVPGQLSLDKLILHIRSVVRSLGELTSLFAIVTNSQVYVAGLYDRMHQWFGDEGPSLASRMLAGLGNNDSAEAGLALWRLSRLALGDQRVANILMTADGFDSARKSLEKSDRGSEFLAAWSEFMKIHGHHCRGELELYNQRWREVPDYILAQVVSYLQSSDGRDFGEIYRGKAKESVEVVKSVRERLKNPFKRWFFNNVIGKARRCGPMRETLKSAMVKRWAFLRALLLEMGDRLAEQGTIDDRDGIFFLETKEVEDVALGRGDPATVKRRVASRRAEYNHNSNIIPPPIVVGAFDLSSAHTEEKLDTSKLLIGVAVNPGVVTGPAKVILRNGEDTVLPGEILVAPFTDPGWTPYFINAAAIVMDLGGLLSHGCIIAREYGIPAVVNVGHATKMIRTGQMIQVDGGRGEVRIL